jgi:hypothetical protein
MVGGDPRTEELFCGQVVEKSGEEIDTTFIETQSVKDHGFDDVRMGKCVVAGFGKFLLDNLGDSKFVNCSGNES